MLRQVAMDGCSAGYFPQAPLMLASAIAVYCIASSFHAQYLPLCDSVPTYSPTVQLSSVRASARDGDVEGEWQTFIKVWM